MLDLSDAPPQSIFPHYDLDELSAALASTADIWVPRLFPNGRKADGTIRLADISGAAPRKNGSCILQLSGDAAGAWYDHSLNTGGGPLSTLQHATGLQGLELLEEAARLSGYSPKAKRPTGGDIRSAAGGASATGKPNLADQPGNRNSKKDPTAEINHILAHAVEPAPDNRVGVYLRTRGLELPKEDSTLPPRWGFARIPTDLSASSGVRYLLPAAPTDLFYNPNVTDWRATPRVGRPCMVAVVRDAAGKRIGIHRTYLAWDGTGKADKPLTAEQTDLPAPMEQPRKMLGDTQGGAVRLFPIAPILGIAEGIETALSVTALFGVPCWAALSAGNLAAFQVPVGVERLIVFADTGEAGEKAARQLGREIAFPRSGDDWNEDLRRGLWKEGETYDCVQNAPETGNVPTTDPQTDPTPALHGEVLTAPVSSPDPVHLVSVINSLTKPTTLIDLQPVLALLIPLSEAARRDNLAAIKQRTGQSIAVLAAELTRLSRGPAPWLAKIITYENAEPRPILENCSIALESDPLWSGCLAHDTFADSITLRAPPPWIKRNGHWNARPWHDGDDIEATRWLQRIGIHAPVAVVHDAVVGVARAHAYHPVRDYLDSLTWDGKPRLDLWAVYYLGAEDSPYTRATASRWLIAAVARIRNPGVKHDHLLILQGPQDMGKSTVFRILFSPWFADEIPDLGSKDAALQLAGAWCIEFAELDVMRRVERNRVKAFLSRTSDRYRPPYGRHAVDVQRQTVFAGTVNEDTFLDDPTGARRFWPIACKSIDLESLTRDRDQLWAEASNRYAAGEKFYIAEDEIKAEAAEQQEARQMDDAIFVRVRNAVAGSLTGDTSIDEILGGFAIPVDRWDRGIQIRIGHALRKLGWFRYRQAARGDQKQAWRYKRSIT